MVKEKSMTSEQAQQLIEAVKEVANVLRIMGFLLYLAMVANLIKRKS